MTQADEDDLKEVLERESAQEAQRAPSDCLLERNGFSNVITILDVNTQMEKDYPLTCAKLRQQAEIGILFIDMHNAGKNPFWHQACAAHAARVKP